MLPRIAITVTQCFPRTDWMGAEERAFRWFFILYAYALNTNTVYKVWNNIDFFFYTHGY